MISNISDKNSHFQKYDYTNPQSLWDILLVLFWGTDKVELQ